MAKVISKIQVSDPGPSLLSCLQFLCYVLLFSCEATSMLSKLFLKKCYPVENCDIWHEICKSCLRKLDAKVSVNFVQF